MAARNPFRQIRLVYSRSSAFLKILILVTILASGIGLEFCARSAGMPSFWK